MTATAIDTAPLLAGSELWNLLAIALADPFHGDRLARLADPALRARAVAAARLYADEAADDERGPGERSGRDLDVEPLFRAFDQERDGLEVAYRAVFGLTVATSCPPCETEFEVNDEVTYRSQRMADVGGFYRAFGLEPDASRGERLDHLTLEAEFYAQVAAREALAREAGDDEASAICADARRSFFKEHLGWWTAPFAALLDQQSASPFYREVAGCCAALVCAERQQLGLPPFSILPQPRPTGDEPDESCDMCHSGGDE